MAYRPVHRSFSHSSSDHERSILRKASAADALASIGGSLWNLLAQRSYAPPPSASSPPSPPEEEDSEHARQEAMWLQACYNAAVLTCVFVAGCICLAVYCVLEPFLQPLLWALLVGLFLHPFKRRSTARLQAWVASMERHHVPLSLGLLLCPVLVLGWLADWCERLLLSYWLSLLLSCAGVAALWLAYALSLPLLAYRALAMLSSACERVDAVLYHVSLLQLSSLLSGFIVVLLLSQRTQCRALFQLLSLALWFLLSVSIGSCLLGRATLPCIAALFLCGGAVALFRFMRRAEKARRLAKDPSRAGSTCKQSGEESTVHNPEPDSQPLEAASSGGGMARGGPSSVPALHVAFSSPVRDWGGQAVEEVEGGRGEGSEAVEEVEGGRGETVKEVEGGRSEAVEGGRSEAVEEVDGSRRGWEARPHAHSQSSQLFLLLTAGCFFVVMLRYPLFLLLLVPVSTCSALKHFLSLAAVRESALLTSASTRLKAWLSPRRYVLFPAPLPTLYAMYRWLDRKALTAIKPSIGSLVSGLMLVGLLLGGCAVTALLLLEVQREVAHYATVSATVWSRARAAYPWLATWAGDSGTFHETVGAVASQGYAQARVWLSSQVHTLVNDQSGNTSQLEGRIVELLDKLYAIYVTSNASVDPLSPPGFSNSSGLLGSDIPWVELKAVTLDNMETVLSVLQSLWSILSNNIALVLSIAAALLELLLSGGTALLNVIVFVTTVFYLLCFSEEEYLPVCWVTGLLPQLTQPGSPHGVGYARAFSHAIRSVFHASLRKALFYGLYTWLLHSLFSLPISVLPSVLAAVAGAMPFIGPYWVALPAVLEVWLLEGRPLLALALVLLSLLPPFWVDNLFYREIEGGHPYLTALAIAGGIYFAGLQGALIGPMLLCCLIFVADCFGDAMKPR